MVLGETNDWQADIMPSPIKDGGLIESFHLLRNRQPSSLWCHSWGPAWRWWAVVWVSLCLHLPVVCHTGLCYIHFLLILFFVIFFPSLWLPSSSHSLLMAMLWGKWSTAWWWQLVNLFLCEIYFNSANSIHWNGGTQLPRNLWYTDGTIGEPLYGKGLLHISKILFLVSY